MTGIIQRLFDRAASSPAAASVSTASGSPLAAYDQRLGRGLIDDLGVGVGADEGLSTGAEEAQVGEGWTISSQTAERSKPAQQPSSAPNPVLATAPHPPVPEQHALDPQATTNTIETIVEREIAAPLAPEQPEIAHPTSPSAPEPTPATAQDLPPTAETTHITNIETAPQPNPEPLSYDMPAPPALTEPEQRTPRTEPQAPLPRQVEPARVATAQPVILAEPQQTAPATPEPTIPASPATSAPAIHYPAAQPTQPKPAEQQTRVIERVVREVPVPAPNPTTSKRPLTANSISKIGKLSERRRVHTLFGQRRR